MRVFSLALVLVLCECSNSLNGNGELEGHSVFYGLALTAARSGRMDTQCKLQLSDVQAAVLNNTRWAVKLLDASGVPQSGLYWGGTYWLGSQSQCKVYTSTKRLGILPSRVLELPHSLPPFPTAYYAAYFRHDSNIQRLIYMDGEDLVTLGLCLPSSCAEEEISELLQDYFDSRVLKHQRVYNMSLKMEGVKKTSDDMSWILSPKHHLFILVTALILILNFAGTFYSAYITKESNKSEEKQKNNLSSNTNYKESGNNRIENGQNGGANARNGIVNEKNGIANGLNGRLHESNEFTNQLNGITKVNDIVGNRCNGKPNVVNEIVNGTNEKLNNANGAANPLKECSKSSIFQKILVGFNIEHNIRKVFDQEHKEDVLLPLNGLRTMLMIMMVYGHITIYAMDKYEAIHKVHYSDDDLASQVFQNAPFIVDTFYCMSGFLLGYTFFKNPKNQISPSTFSETRKDFVSGLLKRFKRLTPLYAFCILSAPTISEWLYRSSALWNHERPDLTCPQAWWANLLYISNVYPRMAQVCMTWGYYLSNDMQFYIAASLLLYISKYYLKMATSIGVGICVASGVYTAYLVNVLNFKPYYHLIFETVDLFYSPPWMRISPYFIGVFGAYLYYHHRDRVAAGKYSIWFLWGLYAICTGFPLFGLISRDISTLYSMLYLSTTRVLWSLGSVWLMVACLTGNAGKFGRIMSKELWIPFAKLTYCVYLINPSLVMIFTTMRDKNLYYGDAETLLNGLGLVVVSFSGALVLVVTIEYPMNNLIDAISKHMSNPEDGPKPPGTSHIITDPKIENGTIPNGRLCFKSDFREQKITPNRRLNLKLE